GAEAVLQLRAIRASKDFDAYWAFHLERERARNHASRYEDGKIPDPLPAPKACLKRVRRSNSLHYPSAEKSRTQAVCRSALAFDVVDVVRVTRMLKSAIKTPPPSADNGNTKLVQLTLPRFARPEHQFQTRPGSKEGK
ncbi:MAG TPA: hypothetical protein VFQ35_09360, partial [Polyangiaceae bacterium]|nr:hypothetical protein [Polyangiaceae bacterium]